MTRGEIWTLAGAADYAGKPRPAVIIQGDAFAKTDSVVVCSFTTNSRDAGLFRIDAMPTKSNGLVAPSKIMVDRMAAVPRAKLGHRIGQLEGETLQRVSDAIVAFLDLAGPVADAEV